MPDNSQFISEDFIDGKVVISGPSRTGKSEQVLNHLNALAQSGERFYLILPSGDYVQRYKKLIAGSAGGYIGSSVMTLNSLVAVIEEASGRRDYREVPGYMLNHMISEIIEKAADSNQLSYFGEAAKLNSFSLELQKLFSEFLHSRLKPDDLIGLNFEGMLRQKVSEIGLIYGEYLNRCSESGDGDFDIRLNNAVDILRSNEECFKDVQAVIIDGFYDYTLLQQELFKTLIGRVKNVLLTRLHDDGREKVFKFADRMKSFYEGFKEKPSKLGKWDNSPIALIRENVFEPEIESSGKKQDIPLRIVEESSKRKLVEELARRIKRLIIDENLSPAEIGLIYRKTNEYEGLIRLIFPRFGIPVTIRKGRKLSSYPPVIYLMKLISLNPGNNFGRDVRNVIRSNYSRISFDGHMVDAETIERVMRASGANDSRALCVQKLENYQKLASADRHISDKGLKNIRSAISQIKAVFNRISPKSGFNKPEVYRSYINDLIKFSGIETLLEEEVAKGKVTNKKIFEEVLTLIGEVADNLSGKNLKYSEFMRFLNMAIENKKIHGDEAEPGGVEVMDVMSARWIRFNTVFICGLTEKEFPVEKHSTRIISNRVRKIIDGKLFTMLEKNTESIQDEERLLYYIALSRADEQVFLCYPTVDSEGRELPRSIFVGETERVYDSLSDGEELPLESGGVRKFHDSSFPSVSDDEILRALTSVGKAEWNDLGDVAVEKSKVQALENMFEATRRQALRSPSYSGIIEDSQALKLLAGIQSDKDRWSATELERYGKCPFFYLVEQIWKLGKVDELEEDVSPLDRGSFYHEVLKRYYSLAIKGELSDEIEEKKITMSELISEIAGEKEREQPGIAPILWELEVKEAMNALLSFLEKEDSQQPSSMSPLAVELSFGMKVINEDSEYSTDAVLQLEDEEFPVNLRGRIDRIDANADKSEFSIIDYKSGSSIPNRGKILNGIALQLPLYVEAVRKLILNQYNSKPLSGQYYGLKNLTQTYIYDSARKDKGISWADAFKVTKEYAGEYVRNINKGKFPVEPKDCKTPCDFVEICRIGSNPESSNSVA